MPSERRSPDYIDSLSGPDVPSRALDSDSLSSRGHALLDRIGIWVSHRGTWCVVIFSAVFWFVAVRQAGHNALLFDEETTWRVVRLPSIAAMWQAILGGVDQELLLTHLLVRLSHSVLGLSHLSTQISSVFGFWICLMSLYVLLKRYVATPYALAGMIFPAITLAWGYALQARAYGVLLGTASVAMVCSQTSTSGSLREEECGSQDQEMALWLILNEIWKFKMKIPVKSVALWLNAHCGAVVAAMAACGLLLRFREAATTYLNPDEAWQVLLPVSPQTHGVAGLIRAAMDVTHPPVLIVALKVVEFFGRSEVTLRG